MLTRPATDRPDCETVPASVTCFLFLLATRAFSVIEPGPTNDLVSTVPATLGVPVPALYGVQNAIQRTAPDGGVRTPLTVKVASISCAPFGERPGVPCGTSAGPRHTWSFAAPSADSAPVVGSTYTGRAIVCPRTDRRRIHTAAC